MRSSAYAFGRRLRDQRERHGVALESIAATTKINASLFAALERGDLSAWPSGIFRRAFVRAYATAIGIAPEPVVAEFAGLFPEDGIVVEAPVVPQAPSELRMTLALDSQDITTAALTRVTIALLEVCLIVAVSLMTTVWGPGIDPWRVCAVLALIYYPLATVFPGRSRALAHIQTSDFRISGRPRHRLPRQTFARRSMKRSIWSGGRRLRRLWNRQRISPAPHRHCGPPRASSLPETSKAGIRLPGVFDLR